ncbi:hypothetical protein FFLO_03005 [Filobasidium floriforme]|uniref:Uncharacterized protein n=2 Tax=Filobasidium floriforme TaxID=5210 RepID=A0A8K0NQQ3_9TREE|nr:hypothetical protein FFLO_03005 [Filobasidium floriforme]
MVFENIGFTRNVKVEDKGQQKEGLKWLICAECDIGPLGWCYEGETEAWLSPSRLKYAT